METATKYTVYKYVLDADGSIYKNLLATFDNHAAEQWFTANYKPHTKGAVKEWVGR